MWRLTIYSAWYGDPRRKQVERVLTYRWHWLAQLRSLFTSGPDPRIARWCEITRQA